ncbi:MAG: putative maturation protein [Alehxovirus pseudofaecicola]|uniref:Maturation protein n=1 Tax=Leviviridae sp. TaxID=2027243 RepID=A0ABY4D5C2_9VIRU|nr:MAG: putative maturation protein [Leviviridae sp.]
MARFRYMEFPLQNGSITTKTALGPPVIKVNEDYFLQWQCSDDTGRKTDHPCEIEKVRYDIVPLMGANPDVPPGAIQQYSSWQPPPYRSKPSHVPGLGLPGALTRITQIQARTNPTRPVVSLPILLYELKDLPGMIRDIGRAKILLQGGKGKHPKLQYGASQYLAAQFGWVPLFSDLAKLLQFTEETDRRVGELRRIYKRGGLKRRVDLGVYSAIGDTTNIVADSTFFPSVRANRTTRTTVHDWGTVRWRPAVGTRLPRSEDELRRVAKSLVLGFHGGAANIWEAIPWSWLIDWCTNVGDYLQATNNAQLWRATRINFMRHELSQRTYTRTQGPPWAGGGSAIVTLETKNRYTGSASLTATLPFLSGRQLSILGALAIQRLR